MTPEQNKNYILNNLDKYIIDGKGNFVNLKKDYKDSDYIIWRSDVKDYEGVKKKVTEVILNDKSKWKLVTNMEISEGIMEISEGIMEKILLEKEDWEIVYESFYCGGKEPKKYRHRLTGEEISASFIDIFNWDQIYVLNGELGWRENIWSDYDKWGHYKAEWWWQKRNCKKAIKSKQNTPSTPPLNKPSENPETEKYKEENKKYKEAKQQIEAAKNQNSKKKDVASPSQNPLLDNSKDNPLPSTSDIQSHYNSDQTKTEIINSPRLTNQEQKEQVQELLKIIITAELLVKEKKSNSTILSQLLQEKNNNTLSYQLLNQEGRMNQVISKLEKIQRQSQQDKNSNLAIKDNHKQSASLSTKIFLGVGISSVILGIMIISLRVIKKKKN